VDALGAYFDAISSFDPISSLVNDWLGQGGCRFGQQDRPKKRHFGGPQAALVLGGT